MRVRLFSIALLIFLFPVVQAVEYGKDPKVGFRSYSIRDGLSHLGVSSFCQDSKGFLWVGTYDGLNRFDGTNFKVFKHAPEDPGSLINNRITCIIEHSSGKLLIGTERGICVYNSEMEVFEEMKIGTFGNRIMTEEMFEDTNGRLWILTGNNAVYVVDFKTGQQKSLFYNPNMNNTSVLFRDIVEDSSGYIWLGSSNGLICYKNDFSRFVLEMPPYLNARKIRAMELDEQNDLWLSYSSTVDEFSLDYSGDTVTMIPKYTLNIESVVTSILSDSKGALWLTSTNEGIFRIFQDNNSKSIENYQYDRLSQESISSNWMTNIYEDNYGNIWFATAEKGINKYTYSNEIFLNFDQRSGLKDDYVMDIIEYDEERLLIGTRRGISVYNVEERRIEEVWFDDSEISNRNIHVSEIHKDKNGFLWFGLSSSLYYLPPGLQKPQALYYSNSLLINQYVEAITEDRFGNLWVGTVSGVSRISFENRPQISEVLDLNSRADGIAKNIKVSVLYVDPLDQSLWMGTWYSGLFHIKINGNEKNANDFEIDIYQYLPEDPNTLRSNFISAVFRAENGDLWIGTEGGGLSLLKNGSGDDSFIHYSSKDGLSNDVVKSILKGKDGKLYIGTNYKLNVFDPHSKTFFYFDVQDGLNSDFFNKTALKLSTHEMVFGGNTGISVFDPESTNPEKASPSPEFGEFLISSKNVSPGQELDGNVVLERSISHTGEIELKYFQNTFSFMLLGISFNKPEDSYFRYRLNNYDKNWIYTRSVNNLASYANVPPGEYMFEFTASNSRNEWSDSTRQVMVKIIPPFWKTGWAYGFYILAFLGIIVLVFRILLNIDRLKNAVQVEQLEKAKEKEVNDIKLKFFTNVSHEFKTPVSLILGPTENLIKEFKEGNRIRYNLLLIHEQANYLLRLVNQLLEFRKVEKETLQLKCAEQDIVSFVRKIVKSFNPASFEKSIQYGFESCDDKILVWFDSSKLEMIIYNLLSNAFKHTPKGGVVNVSIERSDSTVLIKVSDNGPGIPPEEQPMIFERFYQSKSSDHLHGTGIGLTLSRSLARLHHGDLTTESQAGEGATFMLRLLLGKDHLDISEVMENSPQVPEEFIIEPDEYTSGPDTDIATDALTEGIRNLPTLLLIEDNFKLKEYLEGILAEHYHVLSADNGNDGFKLACTKLPDIIVSDVMMPGIDGVQLLKQIKSEICTSHIPVILLTVKQEFDSHIKGLETGADDYITKPFQVEYLLVRIKNILENRARLRIRYSQDFNDDNNGLEESFSVKDNEFINTLYQIAEENLDNSSFSADSFSKAVFMSRTNFYKKLKALTNQTPGEFIRLYRIKRASELLSTGEYSVSQVTQMIGFKSRSHFYQCFKNVYGKLPTEFLDIKSK